MSDDIVKIEIDGVPLEASKGQMIIQVADAADIRIPRFCYHKKLSIAANCRMCLVEVEKAPKPLPACATPVMDGMKIFTKSPLAIEAQTGVMEFLLINHPLDCPICDQGGECELQDVAMGYGNSVSRYVENKRIVKDEDIGPLVSTDMTRCIHCTRCVRFGEEVAGMRELGATGRGENMRIGTYVEKAMASELSGNVIDLCPVGALNNKPYRYSARTWELVQHASIAPHDCVGSHINIHTAQGKIKRVVPRENELINETWLSDRDRFSCEAVNSQDRLQEPMIKRNDRWHVVDWQEALQFACEGMQKQLANNSSDSLAALISPISTLEEHYLLQKLIRGLGGAHIDHRLRQTDFSDQEAAPVMPWLGTEWINLDSINSALLVGSNVRKDQPLAAYRLRKAAMNGADIMFVNIRHYDFNFPVASELVGSAASMVNDLIAIAKKLYQITGQTIPAELNSAFDEVEIKPEHEANAQHLLNQDSSMVLLGSQAIINPEFSKLRRLAYIIAELSNSQFGYLPEAGNTAGAWLAGTVPHRGPAGLKLNTKGDNTEEIFAKSKRSFILYNVEPEFDCANPSIAVESLLKSNFVVSINPFVSNLMKQYSDVILPIATFAETSGTYVNAEGRWQSVQGAGNPVGVARPGWKILRVLGNLFHLNGFEYLSSEDVLDEVKAQCKTIELDNKLNSLTEIKFQNLPRGLYRIADTSIYGGDGLVRRAFALQETQDAIQSRCVSINAITADKLRLTDAVRVNVRQGDLHVVMDLRIDNNLPVNSVYIPLGVRGSEQLGPGFGEITLEAM